MKRTDIHRPAAIVPADYSLVLSYSLPTSQDGYPVPSINVNCELDRRTESKDENGKTVVTNGKHNDDGLCCVLGLMYVAKVKWAPTGNTGKCSVCGANYVYGDVWKHDPTGEHIHIGHNCADKYEMLADRSAWEMANGRARHAAATALVRKLAPIRTRPTPRHSQVARDTGC